MIGGGGSRYRPDDRYGGSSGGGGYPPTRRIPPRYPTGPSRYPMDNSIGGGGGGGGDLGSRYYPENRYPDTRPERYPEPDRGYYPATVTGTRYPTSDNRFPVGNDRSPIFILKYGNRYGGSGKFVQITSTPRTPRTPHTYTTVLTTDPPKNSTPKQFAPQFAITERFFAIFVLFSDFIQFASH